MKFGVSKPWANIHSLLSSLLDLGSLSFSSLCLQFLSSRFGLGSSVEVEGVMLLSNGNDQTSLGEFLDECSSDGSTNLELFNKDSSGDAKDLWNFFKHSFELFVIKIDGIVELFLYLGLGP